MGWATRRSAAACRVAVCREGGWWGLSGHSGWFPREKASVGGCRRGREPGRGRGRPGLAVVRGMGVVVRVTRHCRGSWTWVGIFDSAGVFVVQCGREGDQGDRGWEEDS